MKKIVLFITAVVITISMIVIQPMPAQARRDFDIDRFVSGLQRNWNTGIKERAKTERKIINARTKRNRDWLRYKENSDDNQTSLKLERIRGENRRLEQQLAELQETRREQIRQDAQTTRESISVCQNGNSIAYQSIDGRTGTVMCAQPVSNVSQSNWIPTPLPRR